MRSRRRNAGCRRRFVACRSIRVLAHPLDNAALRVASTLVIAAFVGHVIRDGKIHTGPVSPEVHLRISAT
jgi:hypothetical protein